MKKNFAFILLPLLALAAAAAPKPASSPHPAPTATITVENFKLVGDLSGDRASFTLSATAIVDNSTGGALELVSGTVALTDLGSHPKYKIRAESNRFILDFDHAGKFPIQIKFNAAIREQDDRKLIDFRVAPGPLERVLLNGLPADTQIEFTGAARPERKGTDFVSYLPSDGVFRLAWKQTPAESEGKLFYSSEMLSQISVSPGLLRQVALLNFKVMQGELNRIALLLRGAGEVTRVQGDQVLAWKVEPGTNQTDRLLVIQLNQPQKDQFSLQVQMQTALGAFPQSVDVPQIKPEGATRFAGYFRIVNEGAVRLEVTQATGLSQISPEQFPESEVTKAAFRVSGSQRFAYRFSGGDFALRIQADQVLPELSVSQVLAYRLGENEQTIDGEIELDIREAPLRELVFRIPQGYAIARLNASGLSDYFTHDSEDGTNTEVRLVYGQPISGRQVVQLRLERNKPLSGNLWALPRLDIPRAKSVRGNVGVAADAGFRLTAERTQGLTEVATAFFPAKVAGLQAAFRLSDPGWQVSLRIERIPQTIQVDGFHLFSIGEGIAYGSSVMNYVVSGSPVAAFKIELSGEYYNVEFSGKDIRTWQKTEGGYVVQLHTPITGAYTLLATYERPFKAQGETLSFTGARPLDALSEQGHTLIISAYQFQVKPVEISAGLLPIETAEVPAEYRLFFDAPILAAYRYTVRPFNLKLALSPLAQGDSISQVVDRASVTNHISKEGQVLTDARYFLKNRGNPHFRIRLPQDTQLWSATVNGTPVVPVMDKGANLIPLPQRGDPNAVLTVDLKLASRSKDAKHIVLNAPIVDAPVLLAEWTLEPDTNQRLLYRKGSLTPIGGAADVSGFAAVARMLTGDERARGGTAMLLALVLFAAAMIFWRWATQPGVYKFSTRHLVGALLGAGCLVFVFMAFLNLQELAGQQTTSLPRELTFLAPVQQASSSLLLEVLNLPEKGSLFTFMAYAWPAFIGLPLLIYALAIRSPWLRNAGWLLIAWGALRAPNGAPIFLGLILVFLLVELIIPLSLRLWRLPRQVASPGRTAAGAAPAVTLLFLLGLAAWACGCTGMSGGGTSHHIVAATNEAAMAESVVQDIRIEEKFALATAKIRWQAAKGQVLPLLFDPAVLTHLTYSSNALKLVQSDFHGKRAQQLFAERDGLFDIEVRYELQVPKRNQETGFILPVHFGLVNRARVSVANSDVDIFSPQAVSVQRETAGSNTVAQIVFSPSGGIWLGWKPRSRDPKHEKTVFYAEVSQLYVPAAGVIEGAHLISLRPAQGELAELTLTVPPGATVVDVLGAGSDAKTLVSLWRFDPDTRKLRVTLTPAQSHPCSIIARTQLPSGPLPFEQTVGLLSVDGAAGQVGLLGFATGNEVQLDNANAEGLSPINLEDFPADTAAILQTQIPGLTVRRAFRYVDPKAITVIKASPVEADVRVETQDTLSLGEDRTLLAINASVTISRAGIFRLSFVLPEGFDVETISGAALSHWTELKSEAGRVITLHLNGKTEGAQQFALSLAGAGIKNTNGWAVPQLIVREASKQRGTLLIVPEQGMRLQAGKREGLTQLDPQKAGIRQKGVLSFRVLQTPWNLALDIEQVDPWTQVISLQHALINEAQVKITANFQYQIENTGLKAFRLFMPTNAEGMRFQGEQVADFLPVPGVQTNGLQQWEVKLHRRVIGTYLLRATYQMPLPDNARETVLKGIVAAEVNSQRGFVTVQSGGRLQVSLDAIPETLQATEWQSIPRPLQQDVPGLAANFAFRLVDPAFLLPLRLERHEAAKLLPARVNNITFNSVISDDGVMLTQARLEMLPGDKRLLNLTLPKNARFWFAFVNQNGVWPWREQDRILIPLEQQSRSGQAIPVEIFYSSRVGPAGARGLDLELLAPKFDLPLENIVWRVSLSDKWKLKHWSGSLELEKAESLNAGLDWKAYLQKEAVLQGERTKEAEEFMATGNAALQQGEPLQARRSFQSAYGLSGHDAAFNEDARVQLHNIKLQQALVGLNVRQAAAAGDTTLLGGRLRDLHGRKEVNYTQQDAKDLIDRNTADDNSAFMRLAERIVQQQDAAVSSPAALRASIPDQGRVLTFKRSVVVDRLIDGGDDMKLNLQMKAVAPAPWSTRTLILLGTLAILAGSAWGRRRLTE